MTPKARSLLKFRCTGCGNCCKEPLLPLTDGDVKRIAKGTGEKPKDFIRWVDRHGIEMDDEPEGFVMLRQGKRVMVLRHTRWGCYFLGKDNRCTIYKSRPLGCRIFPFDGTFKKDGKLRHLKLIQAADCKYELDGKNDVKALHELDTQHEKAGDDWEGRIADWNKAQKARKRDGKAAGTAREFFAFMGFN
jgi:Fe-S-cluster containining protein